MWDPNSFLFTPWNGHDMTSKNCTQFKSTLNRLKIERDKDYYILFDIKICAGGILIISKYRIGSFYLTESRFDHLLFQNPSIFQLSESSFNLLLIIFLIIQRGIFTTSLGSNYFSHWEKRKYFWVKKLLKVFYPPNPL